MQKTLLFIASLFLISSCDQSKKFTIEGALSDAKDKTLYLEAINLNTTQIIDSVTLSGDGQFSFSAPATTSPEFYGLRIDGESLTLAVDSSETIEVNANANDLIQSAQIEGSVESKKIKEIALKSRELKKQLEQLIQDEQSTAKQAVADSLVSNYKSTLKNYIFENPRSHTAYYLLLQKVFDRPIFNPYNALDYPAFAAVATSWDTFYPNSPRSKHLKSITLSALKEKRSANSAIDLMDLAKEQNYIEIVLPNIRGKEMKLSDFQGKYVLLDFTAYETEYSPQYNMMLAEVYKEYQNKGLEIFQISLDADEHFWKVTANNLPWVTVRDKASLSSNYARSYNVTNLPTAFLLNSDGELILRIENMEQLKKELNKALK